MSRINQEKETARLNVLQEQFNQIMVGVYEQIRKRAANGDREAVIDLESVHHHDRRADIVAELEREGFEVGYNGFYKLTVRW